MTTWIVTTTSEVANLFDQAKALGGPVTAVLVGLTGSFPAATTNITFNLGPDTPTEAAAPAVAAHVTATDGDVVLLPDLPETRVIAGAIAARLNAPVLPHTSVLAPGQYAVERYGGILQEIVSTEAPTIVLTEGGAQEELSSEAADTAEPSPHYDAHVIETNVASEARTDLAHASRIVALGRGFAQRSDLDLGRKLAAAIGASVACSRPLTEGEQWMPKDSYVGISGQKVSPDLYIAVGISGELQHTLGVRDARIVVAINSDPTAAMFDQADYGIVGDLYQVLPELTAELNPS